MLHLQATMHFPGEGTNIRSGRLGPDSSLLDGFGCGMEESPGQFWESSGLQPASDLLLYSAGAHCCSLFLGDTDRSSSGS